MVKWVTYEDPRQEELPEVPGKPRAKKDRKRWCKGKVGREHVWGPREYYGYGGYWKSCSMVFQRCTNCGKHGPVTDIHPRSGWHAFNDCPLRRAVKLPFASAQVLIPGLTQETYDITKEAEASYHSRVL